MVSKVLGRFRLLGEDESFGLVWETREVPVIRVRCS